MSAKTKEKPALPAGIEPLLSIGQVAAWLDISEDTVARRCELEGLPHRRHGKRYKFVRAEVQGWIDRTRVVKRPPEAIDQPAEAPAQGPAPGGSSFDAEVRATRRKRGAGA